MSERERKVDRLVQAMTWPTPVELDLLDAELQREIAQLAATMMTASARLRALLRPILPQARTVGVVEPGSALDPRPSEQLSRFRPGDYLDASELTLPELREIAATNPLAHWLGPLLDDTLPRLEEAVSDLIFATRRYRLDQRQELREFLRCLPNQVLDRLAELAPAWDDDLDQRRAALQELERRVSEALPGRPADSLRRPAPRPVASEELRPERLGEEAREEPRPERLGEEATARLRPERLGTEAREKLRPERLGEQTREELLPERLGEEEHEELRP